MKQLSLALAHYAAENRELFPPNPDDGNIVDGHSWCGGTMTDPVDSTNILYLIDQRWNALANYLGNAPRVWRCPADKSLQFKNRGAPRVRSVAMNHALGTVCERFPGGHSGEPYLPTHAPWLDNNHTHMRSGPYRTYGKLSDLVEPGPTMTWTFIDEDPDSINDGGFAVGMVRDEWIDWPSTLHDYGASISFADGHVETHRWVDSRTVVINSNVAREVVPGSEDYAWLRDRTSARK